MIKDRLDKAESYLTNIETDDEALASALEAARAAINAARAMILKGTRAEIAD